MIIHLLAALWRDDKTFHGPLALTETCRQIAMETENYWYKTPDLTGYFYTSLYPYGELAKDLAEFRTTMTNRWASIQKLVIRGGEL